MGIIIKSNFFKMGKKSNRAKYDKLLDGVK